MKCWGSTAYNAGFNGIHPWGPVHVSFASVQDQSIPVRLLRNVVRLRRVPHGLLFWGPEGVGKRFTAMEFAKAVNCGEHETDNCGVCLSCRKIDHGNHPDVKLIKPSGKTRGIGVDTVDFINDLASYRPFEGKRRVILIEDADRMRLDAQNHFLKTLEEPASDTTFVLMTHSPGRLLPTIRSRCQQVRFGALRPTTVTELLLRDRDLPSDVAAAIAALSQGQMARALDLVDSEKREIVLDVTRRLHAGDDPMSVSEEFAGHLKAQSERIKDSMSELSAAEKEEFGSADKDEIKKELLAAAEAVIRRDMMEYLYLFQTWYRDGMVYGSTRTPERLLNQDQTERLAKEAAAASEEKLLAIGTAWVYIERNLSIDRVFRDLFLKLAA